jgi:UDP-N-acetylglucosamine:LPS N-acetylglucosamine transferase
MWELGAGGLVAVATPIVAARLQSSRIIAGTIATSGWIAVVASCFVITNHTPFPGWAAALPVLGTMLIIAAEYEIGWQTWRPVHWLGDVSYSVYLWHWPLILILPVAIAHGVGSPGRGMADNAAIIVSTLVLAGLTKSLVEDRFLAPHWTGRRRATYVLGAAGMVAVVGLTSALHFVEQRGKTSAQVALESALASKDPCRGAGSLDTELKCPPARGPIMPAPALAAGDRPEVYADQANGQDCNSDDDDGYPLIVCTFGDPNGTFDLALVGNSHAGQWSPALIEIARLRHWRITTYLAASCATAETKPDWDNGEDAADDCIRWNHLVVDALRADPPDLIVLSNRTTHAAEGKDDLESSYDLWEEGYRRRLLEMSATNAPIALIRDTPASDDAGLESPPDCVASRRNPDDCAGPREEWVPVDPAADAAKTLRRRGISVIDLNDYLCMLDTCQAVVLCPAAVLGVGGYASAPAVAAASTLGIPTFLHEQNSVPGRVNRLASRFITGTFVTFPSAAEHLRDAAWVGMPTRRELFDVSREEALRDLGLQPPVVLIFGGSGGALKLNLSAVEAFRGSAPYSVVQIAGRRDYPRLLQTDNPRHLILEYAQEIWRYLAAAEVVVSRAGAGSLFDTAAVGRATIMVPFPYATGDHQLYNARFFTERGAGELLLDSDVDAAVLRGRVEALLEDERRREGLAGRMRALATPSAADEVAGRLLRAAAERE